MTRFKLLLVAAAVLMTTVAVRPVRSDSCIAYGICQSCTTTKSRPCLVTRCGTNPAHYSCGTCTTDCTPPPA
ncbi:MAG TPA: hypothetical protein VFR03_07475 [Thermoanaerobaculia bacterium]|nr:hypothetical protein [Thermoanaerobaculia bacterium]